MIKVSIILCTYKRCQLLVSALESASALQVSESIDYEIVVVDNNSNDQTVPSSRTSAAVIRGAFVTCSSHGKTSRIRRIPPSRRRGAPSAGRAPMDSCSHFLPDGGRLCR